MITLFDTFSRTSKALLPSDGKVFRFYCCGPTVYGPAHIGNFRTFIVQDCLRRLLEASGTECMHVRNITDVDDKTIRQSQAEHISLETFTKKWTERFETDCTSLNLLKPHVEPKAVAHISHQIKLIEKLVNTQHAYVAEDGSVYYKISSFPAYGRLTHLERDELQSQKNQTNPGQADEYTRESACDFALWKAYKPEDGSNSWQSPWSEGRPGWHIECSAMAMEYLGESFDLHGGGVDLCFPHHENEIAQSEAATGKKLAHHWFHSAHLLVDGQKMSKSLGNLYTLDDIHNKGFKANALRYALMTGHYRQPLNFNLDSLQAAKSALEKIHKFLSHLKQHIQQPIELPLSISQYSIGSFEKTWEDLCDDLNIPSALGSFFKTIQKLSIDNLSPKEAIIEYQAINKILFVLGIQFEEPSTQTIPSNIASLAQERWIAKKNKDFSKSDNLRKEIEANGWIIEDRNDGYSLKPR